MCGNCYFQQNSLFHIDYQCDMKNNFNTSCQWLLNELKTIDGKENFDSNRQ